MSRRRVHPRRPRDDSLELNDRIESKRDGQWHSRVLTGAASTKPYRCPGCDHLIPMATPHVVVWPVEKALLSASAIDERRHWHTHCWKRRP